MNRATPPTTPHDREQRIMVIVAHPDDETIGAGIRLSEAQDAIVVHMTDGAPRTGPDVRNAGCATWRDYADTRRGELVAAMSMIGLSPERLIDLGYPDQCASFHMPEAARRIAGLIADLEPAIVLTQPYEGGHPDHDATAFAVHAAFAMLRHIGRECPSLEEMASYHDGDADGITSFQEFLTQNGAGVHTACLDPEKQKLKRRMLNAFASQATTLAPFRDDIEFYRVAPVYDFTHPPHAGRLNYERFAWGMTCERWHALAIETLHTLQLENATWR